MDISWVDNQLQSRKFILVTGKGGIGKTLVSAALAVRAQHLGRRVLLLEQSAIDQLGPLLGVTGVSHEEQWLNGLGLANLTAAGNFRDFITKHLMKSNLLDVLIKNKLVHSFFTAVPGFAELMLLGRIYYAVNLAPKKPDLVILDAYASGHFLSLMTTPDAVLNSGLAGPIAQQTQKVKNWLADGEQCATFYVATPEDLVLSEALDFLPILNQRSPVKLAGVFMNRCLFLKSPMQKAFENPPRAFLAERLARQRSALELFHKKMLGDKFLGSLPVFQLPDIGAVDEPLKMETVNKFLSRSEDHG
jgi:arsenite/tail-anchored protein-transporting ATPase